MKIYVPIILALTVSACATSSPDFDRDSKQWASAIVGCQSAANVAGTDSDKAIWAYEKQALLGDRFGGWPSDETRMNLAVKKDTQLLKSAGKDAAAAQLSQCRQVINTYFVDGHPAA